jgi:hypothetical protein
MTEGVKLKNYLIHLGEMERGKKDPNGGLIEVVSFAAAKEELRIAMELVEDMNPHALVNAMSAVSLLKIAIDQQKAREGRTTP